MKRMAYCNKCHMAAHVSVPTTYVTQVTGVEIMTCFEIMHIKDMFFLNQWELNGNTTRWLCKIHPFYKECWNIIESQMTSK